MSRKPQEPPIKRIKGYLGFWPIVGNLQMASIANFHHNVKPHSPETAQYLTIQEEGAFGGCTERV
ncbi:MAG: hypothetical protein UU05_C0052G0004 [Candidatus Curtissbacteria bacterium GW2011_GWA1_40_47]|uniref:Uncharacterized protein n=1 Tax=Candidatus Curtissbacteria bacterium RIFOXYA1_FULL_41_14 TaxID=1797737 RepID=A0A1F5HB63_9BACT|nr:MAG: hypothetical protein UT99_C0033G0004 [Candidatus Curtissbacteria bacterium GW2011_GWA2_40_31]KKR61251.1 MAG: hypothetical protein UU00_C0019G0004 [Microgenomates group bacterium GW2011_GWC1_40_35]KKR64346.1 MAG: hypothetical protein UU05_C0052G0004 [Candidatus Curtissbacteria bacterium GW2011_GWA1_40_47]OGD81292.1 MAG: hypothetical protein A2683_03390 [Candidatus Curtissbacteria bacterium RIFCSPHIGHO2_01_FULL_34_40]OGD93425.1 MAG: hypothetical protein A3E14_01340 [Candidatus Curtissbact